MRNGTLQGNLTTGRPFYHQFLNFTQNLGFNGFRRSFDVFLRKKNGKLSITVKELRKPRSSADFSSPSGEKTQPAKATQPTDIIVKGTFLVDHMSDLFSL